MAQFGRPISDLQNTSITGTFADIDEISASDSDYLYSADQANTTYECGLTSGLTDPTTGTSHTFRYRIAESAGGDAPGDGTGNMLIQRQRYLAGHRVTGTTPATTLVSRQAELGRA